MAKLIATLLILLSFFCFLSNGSETNSDATISTPVDVHTNLPSTAGMDNTELWFHWGFPHPLLPFPCPFPFAHPPLPAGGFKGWPHWPFVHPPMPSNWPPKAAWPHWPFPFAHPPIPAGGFKWPPKAWPHWPFAHPPIPAGGFKWPPKAAWPHWPFAHPPIPAGGFKWPPQGWPHWPFVHPPMPAGGAKQWPPHWPWWPHHGFDNVEGGPKSVDAAAPAAA